MSICSWGICSSYVQKTPFHSLFFLDSSLFMADCCILFTTTLQKQNAAPRFPIVSFCLSCLIPAVLLLSSKTASALYRPRTEIFKNVLPCTFLNYEFFSGKTRFCLTPLTSCQYEFDISSNSLSSAVHGRTTLDSGYRFNRCPEATFLIYVRNSPIPP